MSSIIINKFHWISYSLLLQKLSVIEIWLDLILTISFNLMHIIFIVIYNWAKNHWIVWIKEN